MTTNRKKIIEQALDVRTLEEATAVQELIASAIGRVTSVRSATPRTTKES